MNDTELDAALRTRASHWQDEFSPPPLAGMLEVAVSSKRSRLRWAGPLIAAVLLLAIPLITVVSLHHHVRSAPAVTPVPKGTPVGTLAWKDAVLQDDGRTITVKDLIAGVDFCSFDYLDGATATQSGSQVSVTVTRYRGVAIKPKPHAEGQPCSDPAHTVGTLTATLTLDKPLGKRQLVDAKNGSKHSILDAGAVPKAGYLPSGYVDANIAWSEPATDSFERTYASAKGDIQIRRAKYNADDGSSKWDLPAKSTGTVLGHPAKYALWGMPYVTWLDGGYVWSVTTEMYNGVNVGYLSETQLFKVANSLH